ncbi:hypothetical protein C2E23DRAFT_76324 [Lenzites betulinus]|nr:hypothetical protein C2E23DRAFT_76324 [Lenzites betulinus]
MGSIFQWPCWWLKRLGLSRPALWRAARTALASASGVGWRALGERKREIRDPTRAPAPPFRQAHAPDPAILNAPLICHAPRCPGRVPVLSIPGHTPSAERLPCSPSGKSATLDVRSGCAWCLFLPRSPPLGPPPSHSVPQRLVSACIACIRRLPHLINARTRPVRRPWDPTAIPSGPIASDRMTSLTPGSYLALKHAPHGRTHVRDKELYLPHLVVSMSVFNCLLARDLAQCVLLSTSSAFHDPSGNQLLAQFTARKLPTVCEN